MRNRILQSEIIKIDPESTTPIQLSSEKVESIPVRAPNTVTNNTGTGTLHKVRRFTSTGNGTERSDKKSNGTYFGRLKNTGIAK
jgi:hypothetical protein